MSDRRHGVSRLEGFSDTVFGFALTLLVVSLETPRTNEALWDLVSGLVPFALMFAMVCWIWYEHNVFFRRYGLQDPFTVFLNSVLLFVVLFYVYPLKFLTLSLAGEFAGRNSMQGVDSQLLMLLYSTGVLTIFVTFVLLHRHAWRKRAVLGLDEADLIRLRFSTRAHGISAGLAVLSIAVALIGPRYAPAAGMLYGLMGPLHAWNGYQTGKALEAFRTRSRLVAPADPAGPAGTPSADA
jgi:uncharacterized membrane protein